MARVFYVNSATGSDNNTGLSMDAPLASIEAIEQIKLTAGDTVLFARGTTYSDTLDIRYSGSVGKPITFGAYGEGENPEIVGGARGIYGSKAANITIEHLTIADTTGSAIYAGGASNWIVQDVVVRDTGTSKQAGSISFQSSKNITVIDSSFSGVTGDGIWLEKVTGALIEGNAVHTTYGHSADNVQIGYSTNVVVRDNILDMSEPTDSAKGNLVINKSTNVVVEGNTLIGGGFGLSINSYNVVIADNEIYGQGGYKWSFGIGLGERWDVNDYLIEGNYIHNVRFGVAVSGRVDFPVLRSNITIVENTFEQITGAAFKIDHQATGMFSNNLVHIDSAVASIFPTINVVGDITTPYDPNFPPPEGPSFLIENNQSFISPDPTAYDDFLAIASTDDILGGNILLNDYSSVEPSLTATRIGGVMFDDGIVSRDAVSVNGNYGTLTLNRDGSYLYDVDALKMIYISDTVYEEFAYFMSDGHHQAPGKLSLEVAARPNEAPAPGADDMLATKVGTTAGNVLFNDTDPDGFPVWMTSFGGRAFDADTLTFVGTYGVLKVHQSGTYSYAADPAKMLDAGRSAVDRFAYEITDGRASSEGVLSISLENYSADRPAANLKPVAEKDVVYVAAEGIGRGNILANDYDPNGSVVLLRWVGQEAIGVGLELEGTYGTLSISANGEFVYAVDSARTEGLVHEVKDSFFYKISAGGFQDTDSLTLFISPPPAEADYFL